MRSAGKSNERRTHLRCTIILAKMDKNLYARLALFGIFFESFALLK